MPQKEMRHMIKGAAILTGASLIVKILSAIYRVPFQNIVGDEGFYVYQQVYPIYGLAMTLAASGLPQFISKYLAEAKTPAAEKNALQQLLPLLTGLSLLLWGIVFFGSGLIAHLMGDQALQPLIQVVSFTFLLIPGLATYRGAFQSRLQMTPTAISQVVEQVLRVGVILIAAFCFQQFAWDIYQTGTLAMVGAVVGGSLALLLLHCYDRKLNRQSLELVDFVKIPAEKSTGLLGRFLLEGGLLSIYSGYLILFQLVDAFFAKNSLVAQGLSQQAAKIDKGIFDRGQPLVQLGLVVATALSASFLPILTRRLLAGNQGQFEKLARIYLRLSVSLAAAAALGLALLTPLINFSLFKDHAGELTLTLFVLAVALMGAIQAYQSIAQSENRFLPALKAASVGLLIKIIATGPLTYYLGTVGTSLATLLGLTATLLCFICFMPKKINFFLREHQFGSTLLKCLGIMGLTVGLLLVGIDFFQLAEKRWQALLWSVVSVAVGASSFITAAVYWQLFTLREWLMFPLGEKILRLLKRGK
ncbi:PST family polysaccharide transporter [Enterococcus sp. PF1-24]|uniref:putative polysaccharide biosynthesis protein n=1 Tax=unclassified Enterococcus TaxID=2608891 RepID=UPI002474B952|nr:MULTISPECIES: oligosaccharide flippase family protein [unclassified Enterococcus]MDH6363923.1 PST family polysaccharide transporter [Enterococcus sp. PFB1-1]MDH6401024.1 PST family polysaccharide transporter [Enterococcus sp. PF1-24]